MTEKKFKDSKLKPEVSLDLIREYNPVMKDAPDSDLLIMGYYMMGYNISDISAWTNIKKQDVQAVVTRYDENKMMKMNEAYQTAALRNSIDKIQQKLITALSKADLSKMTPVQMVTVFEKTALIKKMMPMPKPTGDTAGAAMKAITGGK